MRIIGIVLIIFQGYILSAQCGNRYNAIIFPNTTTATYQFGENTDYAGANKKLYLDVYTPIGDTVKQRPCVVFCFGGAFVSGNRTSPELVFFATQLAQRGFVCASIDYRLDNEVNVASNGENGSVVRAVQDAKAAIRFLKSKSDSLNIDSNMVFIGGTSAGGITALTLGYSQFDELGDSLKSSINNLGGWEGNTNSIAQSSQVKAVFNFAGAILDTNHIAGADLPVYLNHANGDAVVPFRAGYPLNGQSKTFVHGSYNIAMRMKSKDNFYILDSFKSNNHPAFTSSNLFQALSDLNLTSENLRKFLYKVMNCDKLTSSLWQQKQDAFSIENPIYTTLSLPEQLNVMDIEIYDVVGKKVQIERELGARSLYVGELPRGVYILKYKDIRQKIVLH